MAEQKQKFIQVMIGKKTYVLPLTDSNDFFQIKNIVPVPMVSDKILGLTYHQGHIITVLASDKFFNVKLDDLQHNCLRFDWQGDHYGLIIDKVGAIINPSKITKEYITVNQKKINILSLEDLVSKID